MEFQFILPLWRIILPLKLSILVLAYNHGQFVEQAINSVLMQKKDFEYEIVIGEDCSTDNTRAIVESFQKQYPNHIRLLLTETNLGMHSNLDRSLRACRGEYVAMLEADDFWLDSLKLQTQVAFMDAHPGCAYCFTGFTRVFENEQKSIYETPPGEHQNYTLEDLLVYGGFSRTCTIVFRRSLMAEEPDWIKPLGMADYPMWIFLATQGSIGYIAGNMAVYRVHLGGIWGGEQDLKRRIIMIETLDAIDRYLRHNYSSILRRQITSRAYALSLLFVEQKNLREAKRFLKIYLKRYRLGKGSSSFLSLVKIVSRIYFPRVIIIYGVIKRKKLHLFG